MMMASRGYHILDFFLLSKMVDKLLINLLKTNSHLFFNLFNRLVV